VRALGLLFAVAGVAGFVWSTRTLGDSLTPYPKPREDGVLVQTGPYRLVRHPIYTAGTLVFVGAALAASIPATIAAALLAVLWWFKAGVEERLLRERFPDYGEYRRRVPRRLFL
jgi:protein-S-isoprenylcysteine O-methyltransferase Ste14